MAHHPTQSDDWPFNPRMIDPQWREHFAGRQLMAHLYSMVARGLGASGSRGQVVGSSFRSWRYIKPKGRGRHVLQEPGCGNKQVEIVSAVTPFSPGQQVGIGLSRAGAAIVSPPFSGVAGQSAFAVSVPPTGTLDDLSITSHSPATLFQGVSGQSLTLRGYGFKQTPKDTLDVVEFDDDPASGTYRTYTADPYVSVASFVWVSSTELTVTVDVTATAPIGYKPQFRIRRT